MTPSTPRPRFAISGVALLALLGCSRNAEPVQHSSEPERPASPLPAAPQAASAAPAAACAVQLPSSTAADRSLAEAYSGKFDVGVAINGSVYSGRDPAAAKLVAAQFNRVTAENDMKWGLLEKEPGVLDFSAADAFVQYAEQHGMEVHGHALVWHHQVPKWLFEGEDGKPATREQLLSRLEKHMRALAAHYGDRIHYWDVVNEAFQDDGSLRNSPWRRILGDDYLALVFRMAAKHFPKAKLVYNDFSLEKPAKRDAVVALVEGFQKRGIPIHAIGTQSHFQLSSPTLEEIEASISAFGGTGLEVLVSELDVDVLPPAYANQGADLSVSAELSAKLNPYADCLPKGLAEQAAQRWADIFGIYARHSEHVHAVTLWGVSDRYSWLNNWPVRGRTNYALLFDRELRPKQAWQRVVEVPR